MISAETIEKVREVPILDIVEKYHKTPKKAGKNYVSSCPLPGHKDKHPSFSISPSKGIAKCFVCDVTFDGISMVMEVKNLNYPQAVKLIANDFNIKIVETGKKSLTEEDKKLIQEKESLAIATQWAADWYHAQLLERIEHYYPSSDVNMFPFGQDYKNAVKHNEEEAIIIYILERFRWDLDLIKEFKIGFAPTGYNNLYNAAIKAGYKSETLAKAGLIKHNNKGVVDCFIFRPLIFPIHSERGIVVGFSARKMPWDESTNSDGKPYPKFINTAETLIYKKYQILYGFNMASRVAISDLDKAYIVEGNTDKTSLFQIGVKNAVAKSGTALTKDQINSLKKLTKNICLVDDGDNAGQLSMLKNGEALTKAGCNVTVITLPEETDPDSLFTSKEIFDDYESNEQDYIIDIRAIKEFEEASNVQMKKKVKMAVAELLLTKQRDDRDEYVSEIVKNTDTNQREWNQAIKQATFAIRNKGLNIGEDEEEKNITPDNSSENFRKHNFYRVKKDKSGNPTGLEIDERRFLMRLKSTQEWEFENNGKTIIKYFGFYTYTWSIDGSDIEFVQLRNGMIKRVSTNIIKQEFIEYIRLLKPIEYSDFDREGKEWKYPVSSYQVETLVLRKVTSLFEEKRLVLFPDKPIVLLQDSIDKHFTFFRNCYVVSNKDGYTVHEYQELKDGYVWDDAVLDRDFKEPKDNTPGIFEKFVHDISGNEWNMKDNTSLYPEQQRYKSLLIAGGYQLHNYTEMTRKAVILTQGRVSDDDTSEGREGKTLFVESLGRYMLNKHPDDSKTYIFVSGKDMKSDDKHKWMDLEQNTTCVLFDDPPAGLNFEELYIASERAFKVEKKGQSNIHVKSRLFITTNRPINREGGSSKARSCVIELDSIFHADYSPTDKYKHFFFRDWKGEREDEWHKFDKYVLGSMLPEYFKNNCQLIEPPAKNLYRNELLQMAIRLSGNVEIVFWLDYLCQGDIDNEPFFRHGETYETHELYKMLLEDRDYKDNRRLKNNFAKIIKGYFDKEGIAYKQERNKHGATFTIKKGLPKNKVINPSLIEEFFNNKELKYKPEDIMTHDSLRMMTYDFNDLYSLDAEPKELKKAIEAFNEDIF